MNALRASFLGLILGVAGFAGAQALASQSPPLVSNCVNAADGWEVEVLHIDCIRAGKIVRRLTVLAPKAPIRFSGMTCIVRYAGKIATAIRCAHGERFLRANLQLKGAKATPLPTVARCRDYVDKLKRRWVIRSERFSCLDAKDIVSELTYTRPTADDVKYVERSYNVGCWLNDGLPRVLFCWRTRSSGHFHAHVKLAPTPSTTAETATIERP